MTRSLVSLHPIILGVRALIMKWFMINHVRHTDTAEEQIQRGRWGRGHFSLAGGVGARARPVTPAARRTRPATNRRASPWRPRPPPHARRSASPHWRRWGHPAGRRQPAGGRTHCGSQNSCDCDLLAVDLTSIHMFQGLLRLVRSLKLHVGVAFGQVREDAVHGHVDDLDLAVSGEDLQDVFLDNISGQPAQVDLGGFGCGAPTPAVPVVLLC